MNYVKLIAPAKINLVLAVGERLPDGYHEVRTILHALALHDTLEIRRFESDPDDESCAANELDPGEACSNSAVAGLSIKLSCETAGSIDELAISPEDNIVYQAAIRLAEATGYGKGEELHIVLSKQIPHQAGLGGGSADAAATLKGLAHLWEIDPEDPVLVEVAASLGVDVPFFLYGGCAYLDGKGEHFVHCLEPRKGFLTLIRPQGSGVPTKEAYQRFDEDPVYPSPALLAEIASIEQADQITPYNNLTDAALSLKPELQEVFDLIESSGQAQSALLCGSGSTVAALCENYEQACALSVEARKAGYYSRVTSFAPLGAEVVKKY